MHCPWCSNPEGMDFSLNKDDFIPNEEIVDEIIRSKLMFFDDGGVTFTGGEATCQFEELKKILIILKEKNISIAVETNGTSVRLEELFYLIDELIIDFKHYDSDYHKEILGVDNKVIKQNLALAFKNHKNVLVRIPLIKWFNASEKDLEEFVTFFKLYDTSNARFEILRYHEYGKEKWKMCNKEYKVQQAFVAEEVRLKFENEFLNNGLKVIRT